MDETRVVLVQEESVCVQNAERLLLMKPDTLLLKKCPKLRFTDG